MNEILKLRCMRMPGLSFSVFVLLGLSLIGSPLPAADGARAKIDARKGSKGPEKLLIRAARVFDGVDLHFDGAVLISGRKVKALGSANAIDGRGARRINLGDSTILPGTSLTTLSLNTA